MCDNISSLAINGTESTGVTDFVQEACEAIDVLPSLPRNMLVATPGQVTQDLREYFSRPRQISSGSLPSTRTNVTFIQPSSQTVLASWFVQGFNRLLGTFGWRGTLVYRLQVNATPFHAGLLSMAVGYGIKSGNQYAGSRVPQTSTNYHHVRLDLSETTQAVLKVPFLMEEEYVPTNGNFGTIAMNAPLHEIAINMLTPVILPSGLAAPVYNLYVHMEDLELFGATNPNATTANFQSGGKTPKSQEFENDAYPLSSSLHSASKALRFLMKGVPALSSIGTVPYWALSSTAKALRSFGYSKPTIQEPPTKMNAIYGCLEHNVDQPQAVQVVGPFASQDFAVGPHFCGTDIDEMALSFVTSQWSQTAIFQLDSASAANKPLWAAANSPSSFWFRAPPNSTTAGVANFGPLDSVSATATPGYNGFQPTSLLFASAAFQQWRGSIKYRFTFVKTKMHAGRVLVSFSALQASGSEVLPYITDIGSVGLPGPEVATGRMQPFGLSAIFDLRDGNVFEFEVPYMSQYPWCRFENNSGVLSMFILDPLIASSVVGSSIYCMVEVCGGSDFELSVPVTPRYAPFPSATVRIQSGTKLSNLLPIADQYTVGNKVNSIKQLIMIPTTTSAVAQSANQDRIYTIMPWYYSPLPTALGNTSVNVNCYTYGGYFSSAYAYVRGGTDLHIYASNIANMQVVAWQTDVRSNADSPSNSLQYNPPVSATPRIWSNPDAPIHYRYPQFLQSARIESSTYDGVNWNLSASPTDQTRNPSLLPPAACVAPATFNRLAIFNRQSGQSQPIFFNRCASEDASCGVYQGPPPMYIITGPLLQNPTARLDPNSNPYNWAIASEPAAQANLAPATPPPTPIGMAFASANNNSEPHPFEVPPTPAAARLARTGSLRSFLERTPNREDSSLLSLVSKHEVPPP